jgi:hypothetical protein
LPEASPPILLLSALVLLGACAGSGPSELATSRTYQGLERQVVYERTVAALKASAVTITGTDQATGVITAAGSFDRRDWAECSRSLVLVEDSEERHNLAAVPHRNRRVEVRASIGEGPGGATLTLVPAFTAERVSLSATTPRCRTTGALERQIFEAVAKE